MASPIIAYRGSVSVSLPGLFGVNGQWPGFTLASHDIPPGEYGDSQFRAHLIGLDRSPVPYRMSWKENGSERSTLVGPGAIFVRSQQPVCALRLAGTQCATLLTIDEHAMELALPEPFQRGPVELLARPAPSDPMVGHLIGAMEAELRQGAPVGELLLDCLGKAMALYLAAHYSTAGLAIPVRTTGLSRDRLARVREYIDANLSSPLSLDDLAAVACLSTFHFGRMFKASMGRSVHRYVLEQRVERAKSLLRSSDLTLAGIAAVLGFSSQSQFTTVFRRIAGTTPGAWRLASR